MRPKRLNVKITIPFLGEIGGEWEPDDAEQRAAWELYVELVTRVSVAPLREEEGSAREALTSMYVLFATVRDILKRYGPDVAPPGVRNEVSFGVLAVTVLNRAVRPVLSKWHPQLTAWESSAPAGRSAAEHENTWQEIGALRADLDSLRLVLLELAQVLGDVAGAADLIGPPMVVPAQASQASFASQPPAPRGPAVS
ncbi:hypothetical protein [Streptomyces sp. SID3212]|uniref:hypothetical protein n=1 Tax=Streptomyces sp. SID3212 TaxID=2690259 RepID=UPI00136A6A9C|nr:hypothetical protein [Streptomyces sp. SID3212]MYV54041.1 hypothetical protein [Streptomyces sp. SID3212]